MRSSYNCAKIPCIFLNVLPVLGFGVQMGCAPEEDAVHNIANEAAHHNEHLQIDDIVILSSVAVGDRVEETIDVKASDGTPLRVVSAAWTSDATGFGVETLADGRVRISAEPSTPGERWATLAVSSEEGAQGVLSVGVEARAGTLRVWVEAPINVPIGCEINGSVWLENTGTDEVVLTSLTAEGGGWNVDFSSSIVLGSGEQASFSLTRTAAPDVELTPNLSVGSDAFSAQRLDEAWVASVAEASSESTTSIVPRLGAVDIVVVTGTENLWPGNTSDPTLTALPALADALSAQELDWQMSVISNALGCPSADWPVLTEDALVWTDPSAFIQMLLGPTKCDVTGHELSVAARTFAGMTEGGCAQDLLRQATPVEVVLLRRAANNGAVYDWPSSVDTIVNAVLPGSVRIHEWTYDGVAVPGWVEETGGAVWDVGAWMGWMGSFVGQLGVVSAVTVEVGEVVPSSVQVWVDGAEDHRWTLYEGTLRWPETVALPPGSTIEVRAVPLSECPQG